MIPRLDAKEVAAYVLLLDVYSNALNTFCPSTSANYLKRFLGSVS